MSSEVSRRQITVPDVVADRQALATYRRYPYEDTYGELRHTGNRAELATFVRQVDYLRALKLPVPYALPRDACWQSLDIDNRYWQNEICAAGFALDAEGYRLEPHDGQYMYLPASVRPRRAAQQPQYGTNCPLTPGITPPRSDYARLPAPARQPGRAEAGVEPPAQGVPGASGPAPTPAIPAAPTTGPRPQPSGSDWLLGARPGAGPAYPSDSRELEAVAAAAIDAMQRAAGTLPDPVETVLGTEGMRRLSAALGPVEVTPLLSPSELALAYRRCLGRQEHSPALAADEPLYEQGRPVAPFAAVLARLDEWTDLPRWDPLRLLPPGFPARIEPPEYEFRAGDEVERLQRLPTAARPEWLHGRLDEEAAATGNDLATLVEMLRNDMRDMTARALAGDYQRLHWLEALKRQMQRWFPHHYAEFQVAYEQRGIPVTPAQVLTFMDQWLVSDSSAFMEQVHHILRHVGQADDAAAYLLYQACWYRLKWLQARDDMAIFYHQAKSLVAHAYTAADAVDRVEQAELQAEHQRLSGEARAAALEEAVAQRDRRLADLTAAGARLTAANAALQKEREELAEQQRQLRETNRALCSENQSLAAALARTRSTGDISSAMDPSPTGASAADPGEGESSGQTEGGADAGVAGSEAFAPDVQAILYSKGNVTITGRVLRCVADTGLCLTQLVRQEIGLPGVRVSEAIRLLRQAGLLEGFDLGVARDGVHPFRLTGPGQDVVRGWLGHEGHPCVYDLLLKRHKTAEHAYLNLMAAARMRELEDVRRVDLFPDSPIPGHIPDLALDVTLDGGELRRYYVEAERAGTKQFASFAHKLESNCSANGGTLCFATTNERDWQTLEETYVRGWVRRRGLETVEVLLFPVNRARPKRLAWVEWAVRRTIMGLDSGA
jgi:hypothetical protein